MNFELKLPETVCLRCGAPIMSVGEDSFIACEHCGTVMEVTRFTKEEKRLVQAMEEMQASVEQAKQEADEAMKRLMETGEKSAADAKAEAQLRHQQLKSQLTNMQNAYMSTHEKELNGWYSWGEKAQRAGRYDEAIGHYQKVLASCQDEAEVYWRIVLCRYGVEYVKDQSNNIFIPTLTRMQVDSILDDADYESAIRCARSQEAKAYYTEQAEHLERILRQYQYICGSEEPYDVFISVKQGDEHGRATTDREEGMRLYYRLREMGLRVFNSNESLAEKAGHEYEPYIMHALMTAKLLVVIASREEYINAPWVRNEWRRFRWLRENDGVARRRLLVYSICQKKLVLPAELGMIQMIDTKTDSAPVQHLCEIAALLKPEAKRPQKQAASAVDPQEARWLKRAKMYLDEDDFDQCDAFCEKVLDRNPESGMAYVYKLCVECRVREIDELAEQQAPLDKNPNYRFALKYGGNQVADQLKKINEEIKNRVNESKMREQVERKYREKAEKERAEREAAEKAEREKQEREKIAREQREREAAEKAEREKQEREKIAREQREREAADKAAREKQEREKIAREAAEKIAREKAAREAAEKAAQEAREKLERERLAQKQRESAQRSAQVGEIVIATVTSVSGINAEVTLENGQKGSIHVSHCAAVNVKRPGDVLKVGDVVRAKVMSENRTTGKLVLSIREAMSEAEKQAAQNAVQAEQDRIDAQLSKNKVWEGMRHDPERAEELLKEGQEYSKKGQYKMAVARYKMSAELGSGLAMYNLGQICENKYTGFYDLAEAFNWYLKGAEAGNSFAINRVAEMYEKGICVQKNLDEAAKWYKKGADNGWEVSRRGYQRVEIERVKEKGVQNVAFLYDQGMRMYNAKQFAEAAKAFESAANHNNADASYQLSVMYGRGEGVAKDQKKSDEWLHRAGELGSADACFELAMMYHFGTGVAKDMKEAAKWYRKAAELGHADCMYFYGMRCYNGEGVAKDLAEAEKWFRKAVEKGQKEAPGMLERVQRENRAEPSTAEIAGMSVGQLQEAAERGSVAAMYHLGTRYDLGGGVSKNAEEAVRWYTMAGNHGHTLAMNRVGVMHAHGDGCTRSLEKAVEWYRKSAEAGDIYGMGNLASMLEQGIGTAKDLAGALMWYEKAVKGGNDKAKESYERVKKLVGSRTNTNEDAEELFRKAEQFRAQRQHDAALDLYLRAADLGHAGAMDGIGWMYKTGWAQKAPKDMSEAVRWYRKSADKGYAEAMVNLGLCYANGTGTVKDEQEALRLYRKAAELGNASGMNNLGSMYENGRGVAKDFAEAAKWYEKAAALGHENAPFNLKRVNRERESHSENAASLYEQGKRLYDQKEYRKAVELYRRAAEAGSGQGWHALGECYIYGNGVAADDAEAFRCFSKSAETGYPDGMLRFGWCYKNGRGVKTDFAKAFEYYSKAADKGLALATSNLAMLYANGEGVAKNLAEATRLARKAADAGCGSALVHLKSNNMVVDGPVEDPEQLYSKGNEYYNRKEYDQAYPLFRKAAELGHARAMNMVGYLLQGGFGVEKNPAEATKWYQRAADLGNVIAAFNIALCYANAIGVAQNYAKAAEYYRKAADSGDEDSMNNLGRLYEDGNGVEKNLAEAARWFRLAADKGQKNAQANLERVNKALAAPKEDAATLYNQGYQHYSKGEFVQAVNLFRRAAELGDASAMNYMGICYAKGEGVQQNAAEAFSWYKKAAEKGEMYAMNNLAWRYEHGEVVAKDLAEAFKWYKKAAELGHVDAMNSVGICYAKGEGVQANAQEAYNWYRKAADRGNMYAMSNVGWRYEHGEVVAKDLAEAAKWYKKAVDAGYKEAQANLDRVNKELQKPQKKGLFGGLFRK